VEVGPPPQLSIVVFRFANNLVETEQSASGIPPSLMKADYESNCDEEVSEAKKEAETARDQVSTDNKVNRAVVEAVTGEGIIYLGIVDMFGLTWIRLAILSFRSHKEDIDLALKLLVDARGKVLSDLVTKSDIIEGNKCD